MNVIMRTRDADSVTGLAEFWDVGHKLFKSSPGSSPITFVAGDVFDPTFLALLPLPTVPPSPSESTGSVPPLDLSTLTTLTPLHGRLSIIHASSFFHLFDEAGQRDLAHRLASLLSPEPGSLILGQHGATPYPNTHFETTDPSGTKHQMFCHSPESWKVLWEEVFGGGGPEGKVKVEAELIRVGEDDFLKTLQQEFYFMQWSVTRI